MSEFELVVAGVLILLAVLLLMDAVLRERQIKRETKTIESWLDKLDDPHWCHSYHGRHLWSEGICLRCGTEREA